MSTVGMRLQQALKVHGTALPAVLLLKVLRRYLKFETVVVYSHGMHEQAVSLPRLVPAVQVQAITDAGCGIFRRLCESFPERGFAARLARDGYECYVALRDGTLCGHAWVARRNLYVDEIAFEFPVAGNEICIFDCHVEPGMRGAGIFPLMLALLLKDQDARHTNLQRAHIAACAGNHASRRGICKAGFVPVKRIYLLEFRGRRVHWESAHSESVHGRSVNENVDAELALELSPSNQTRG